MALSPSGFLAICDDRKSVVAPHLIFGGAFRVLDLRLQVRPVIPIKLAADYALLNITGDPFPRKRQLHLLAHVPPGLLETPHKRARIEARRLPAIPGPFGELCAQRASAGPLRLGIGDNKCQPRKIGNIRAFFREALDADAGATQKLVFHELAYGGLDFGFLVERRTPVADNLFQGRLISYPEPVRSYFAQEIGTIFEGERSVVDRCRVQLRLAQGEAEFREMRDLIGLSAR